MPNQMRLQTAARSPLLQQLMARRASQGPTDFRGQHPLAAAMHGITQGLEMRALRKAEAEKQKRTDSANTNLQNAISGLPLPPSKDEFKLNNLQEPGTPEDILAAAMNPEISRQQAQIAGAIAQGRQPKAGQKLESVDPTRDLIHPITGEIVRKGVPAESKPKEVIGKINPEHFTPETMESFNKTVKDGEPDYSVLRFSDRVAKTMEVRPVLTPLSAEEKKRMGLNPLNTYLPKKDGTLAVYKGSNMTDAFKMSQLESARRNWSAAKDMIFETDEDGNIRFNRLKRGWQQLVGGAGGRAVFALGFQSIETYLRGTSGAAVPETEVDRAMRMFMPDARDTNDTAQIKMKMLEDFLDGTYDILVPGNASIEEREAIQIKMIDAAQEALTTAIADNEAPVTTEELEELKALQESQGVK